MVKILYKTEALKKLKRIDQPELKKIKRKILVLAENPLSGKLLQGEYEGQRSLRAWPLRIIYTFDSDNQHILIQDIDYRGNVYRK